MNLTSLLWQCSLGLLALTASGAWAADAPLALASQGARPFAGTVLVTPDQGSIHCDHGYVEWQIPSTRRRCRC